MKLTLESCKYCKGEGWRGFYLKFGHLNVHFNETEARHLLKRLQGQVAEWDKEPKERTDHAD